MEIYGIEAKGQIPISHWFNAADRWRLIGAMQEATQGISIVKAFTMEDQLAGKIDKIVAKADVDAVRRRK